MDAPSVIEFFLEREGFEDWWSEMDKNTRQEIIEDLQRALDKP